MAVASGRPGCGAGWVPALALALAGPAAAQLELEPALGVSLVASDNIELRPADEARGELVTLVNPALRLASRGSRHELDLRYRMDLLYYARSDDEDTRVFNDLDSRLGLRLVGDNLSLDSRATVTQINSDPRGGLSGNNIALTGNRTNAVTLETRPIWRQALGRNLLTASYAIGELSYGDDRLLDTAYQVFDGRLDSGEVEQGLGWALTHNYRRYSYDELPDYRNQLLELTTYWNNRSGVAPFVTVGLESDYRDRTGSGLDDALWLVGLRRSSERLAVELAAGQRSYGDTLRAQVEYRYGSDSGDLLQLRYSELPTNSEEQLLNRQRPPAQGLDPELPPDLEQPGSGRVYTRKRLELLLRREFNRAGLGLRLYSQRDTDFLLVDGSTPRGANRENGVSAEAYYQLGSATRLRLDGVLADRRFGAADEDNGRDRRWRLRAGVDYALGQRTTLGLYGERQVRSGAAVTGYRENQVGLRLDRRFY